MKQKEYLNIKILVKDEQDLYMRFSPADEFSDSLKRYIRSKTACADQDQHIKLEVTSSAPLDQERFRSAAANWINEEKALFRQEFKRNNLSQIRMLILGIVFIIIGMLLESYINMMPLIYMAITTIGSFGLGRAVAAWIEQLPENRKMLQLTNEMEKTSLIEFIEQ